MLTKNVLGSDPASGVLLESYRYDLYSNPSFFTAGEAPIPAGSAHFAEGETVRFVWSKDSLVAMETA